MAGFQFFPTIWSPAKFPPTGQFLIACEGVKANFHMLPARRVGKESTVHLLLLISGHRRLPSDSVTGVHAPPTQRIRNLSSSSESVL